MKTTYFVNNQKELATYQDFLERHQERLDAYIDVLKTTYGVQELPRVMVLANSLGATKVLRNCPIPAYTNDVRLVITPDVAVWQEIYLTQLEHYPFSEEIAELLSHYQHLTENHLLQIIGHELAHWSEWFADDFDGYDSYIWFEEGMVEYISRRFFLTSEEFEAEKRANQLLVKLFQEKNGWHSLNDFGQSTYEGDMASIFYEYWRSFLTIDQLVDKLGTVEKVFECYRHWLVSHSHQPLLDWLMNQNLLDKER